MLGLYTQSKLGLELASKQQKSSGISFEYIRGLVDGEGSFSFCNIPVTKSHEGQVKKFLLPAFILSMHARDKDLLMLVKNKLKLKNRIYEYRSTPLHMYNKSYKRGNKAILIVRDFPALKNVIVPLFYGKLQGYKRIQFHEWLERIGSDTMVVPKYKLIYRLHKNNYFVNNPKYD